MHVLTVHLFPDASRVALGLGPVIDACSYIYIFFSVVWAFLRSLTCSKTHGGWGGLSWHTFNKAIFREFCSTANLIYNFIKVNVNLKNVLILVVNSFLFMIQC